MTATVEQIDAVLTEHGAWTIRSTTGRRGLVHHERSCRGCGAPLPWREAEAAVALRRHQAEQVAALGVGDGEVEERIEWGVRVETRAFGVVYRPIVTREAAEVHRDAVRAEYGGTPALMQRKAQTRRGPWVEVTDEGGEG